jgi:hypothetical protein
MKTKINDDLEDYINKTLENIYKSINITNLKKETEGGFTNSRFFFGYPRSIKFNFNLLIDHSTQDEVKVEFEIPMILKKTFTDE